MIPVVAFEPVTAAVALGALLFMGFVGLMVVWWMVKSAVRMAVKLVVFGVLTVGALALGAGIVAMMLAM
jgi:hypothetical protein